MVKLPVIHWNSVIQRLPNISKVAETKEMKIIS